MSTLGSRLKACRKESGLKQEAVCARVGISQGTLSELENDKYPTSSFVPHFAILYGVEAMWLAEGRGSKIRSSAKNKELPAKDRADAFLLHKIAAIEAALHIIVSRDDALFKDAEDAFSLYAEAMTGSDLESQSVGDDESAVRAEAIASTKNAIFWKPTQS